MQGDFSRLTVSLLLVGLFTGIDLWTKHAVLYSIDLLTGPMDLGGMFTIVEPVRNYGGPGVFSSDSQDDSFRYWHIFGALASLACFRWLVMSDERLWHSAIGAVPVGGMWGNVYEFLFYGSVTDFIILNGSGVLGKFIFNVADVFIFAGLALYYLTAEMRPYDKMIALLLHVSIFSVILSILPSEPSVYIAIGCLYYLLIWPDPEEEIV